MIGRRLSPELRMKAGAHIKQTAKRLDARVTFSIRYAEKGKHREPYGSCDLDTRRSNGPPIRTALDYFVHLHELGHIAARTQGYGTKDEAAAWTYATAHALPEIMRTMTETAWAAVGRWFTSYMEYETTKPLNKRQK